MSLSESKDSPPAVSTRPLRSALLRKQPEIEEVDEEDTSPGSDQSDSTITAGTDTPRVTVIGSPESGSPEDDLKPSTPSIKHTHHISPKLKQLTRSEALCEECASPPLDPLKSTASTCSSDSSSSGIGTKSSITSGSISGSSFHGRLEKDGSQSSEAGTSSSLSRDSSVDTPYKDSTGIDLEDFIKKTLNKTPKDRSMLIKLEVDLIKFIREPKHHYLKFPQMSSYDRMLVHRIAAFFGLDHNVDQTGKCVIVNKTANTRIPDFSFQEHVSNGDESKPKKLLTRGGGSFDELTSRSLAKPSLDTTRAAKSLEERQQEYEEVRSRIFTGEEQVEAQPTGYCQEDVKITGIVKKIDRPSSLVKDETIWSSVDSSGYGSMDNPGKVMRLFVPKANSFGGTGTFVVKSPMRGGSLSKADSLSMGASMIQPNFNSSLIRPVVMSSPTCSQSDNSSVSGSSSSGLAPSPHQGNTGQSTVVWIPSDLNNIPAGSMVINPQTGLAYMNADGTPYKHMPGQPLPQPSTHYTQQQQPQPSVEQQQQQQVYQVQQEWSSQMSQESQSSQDVCQQLSVMQLTPQSSLDSAGATGDNNQQQQSQLINQNIPMQQPAYIPSQMSGGQTQGIYYQGSPAVQGQQMVKYMCPYNVPGQGVQTPQGYAPIQTVPIDSGGQGQQYTTHYCQQYVPNYQGNQMYSMTSQGQAMGGVEHGDVSYQCGYSVTSPVEGQNNNYSFPVPFSQQQTVITPNQSQMLYVRNQQANPAMVPHGYVYSGQQGTSYQSNTPPSQNNSTVTPNVQMNPVNQPVNMSGVSNISVTPQQTPGGVVQGSGVNPGQSAPYISSLQSSYPIISHHTSKYHQPQSFSSPVRHVNPQIVPIHGLQMQGQSNQVAPTFQGVYRPNMQLPMQMHPQQQQQGPNQQLGQQQQQLLVTAVSKSQHQSSSQHVTVSAKGLTYDTTTPGTSTENGGSGQHDTGGGGDTSIIDHMTNVTYRPQMPSQEVRVQYQPNRPQVQTVQFPHPQTPTNRSSPTTPKPQRTKKLGSRDKRHSEQAEPANGNGQVIMSNVLEVCDLPELGLRSEYESVLNKLIKAGADIQLLTQDGLVYLNEMNSNHQTISLPIQQVFAVFSDSDVASQVLKSHSCNKYKLRMVDNIGESSH
ncbi:R3H domain-containing protein 1 [Mactra antiquata]